MLTAAAQPVTLPLRDASLSFAAIFEQVVKPMEVEGKKPVIWQIENPGVFFNSKSC